MFKFIVKSVGKLSNRSDSLVYKIDLNDISILSRAGHVKSCLNPPEPSGKAKYSKTDSERVL